MVSEYLKEYLDREVERFSLRFNDCRARFAKITGKRISHISGESDSVRWGELKLHINSSVVLFVDGVWDEIVTDISCYAHKLADRLREIPEISSQETEVRIQNSE